MNILFVHERASFTGGVEQNIGDCVRGLRARGVRCHLAYNGDLPVDQSFLELFETATPAMDITHGIQTSGTKRLRQIAEETGVRCIFLHKVEHVPHEVFHADARIVQMVHDHDLYCPRRHKYRMLDAMPCDKPAGLRCYTDFAFLQRDASRATGFAFASVGEKIAEMRRRHRCDLSLVASGFMRDQLVMNGFPKDRVRVLPLAVQELPSPPGHGQSQIPTVLYVGQLIRGKGVDSLLRAISHVKVPVRAIIVGKGNAEESLRSLAARLGLSDAVRFMGWLDNTALPQMYATCDVVVVPSRWPEPFGMVGLEAMRHGKPVVAFNTGGISEWLEHRSTGLLVPQGDVDGLGYAIESLVTNQKLAQQYGRLAAEQVRVRFGFEQYISKLLDALLSPSEISTAVSKERVA